MENRVLLAADMVAPFQNSGDRFDVNHDGNHTINDALQVIVSLRQTGPRPLVVPLASQGRSVGEGEGEGSMSIDVNGDNMLTLSDALDVLSRLRSEGEDDAVTTPEDTSVFIDVLDNDTGASAAARIISISQPIDTVSGQAVGSIIPTFNNSGNLDFSIVAFTFVPETDYSGQVRITYTWNDTSTGQGGSSVATVTVNEVNDPPRALIDSLGTVPHGGQATVNLLANDDTAPDTAPNETAADLSVTAINGIAVTPNTPIPIIVSDTQIGTATVNSNNTLTFVADNPMFFNPNGGTVSFSYTVSDSGRAATQTQPAQAPLSSTSTVSVNVIPVAPTVRYTVEAVNATTGQILTSIQTGQTFNLRVFAQDLRDPSEVCTYGGMPRSTQCDTGVVAFGIDLGFDPAILQPVETSPGVPSVTINPLFNSGPNPPPSSATAGLIRNIAQVQSFADIINNGPLGPNRVEVATVAMRAIGAGMPTIAPLYPSSSSSVTSFITPALTVFTPGDATTYSNNVQKFDLVADTFNVVAPVDAMNDAFPLVGQPAILEDSATATLLTVIGNDTVTAGGNITLTAVSTGTQGGTISVGSLNRVSYRPAPNFNGTEQFTYTIVDGRGNTDTASVVVTVTAVNDPPVANNDTATVVEDSSNNPITVLTNDNDGVDTGETLTITGTPTLVSSTPGGSVLTPGTMTNQGTQLSYTPAANFFGTAVYSYTISDGNGGTATAQVTVTVTNLNDSPVATNDTATFAEGSANNLINVLTNDNSGVDAGETLTISGVTFVSATPGGSVTNPGTMTIQGTQLSYTPTDNFFGTAVYSYTISDGNGGTATANVTVTVTNVNDAPIAVNDTGFEVKAGESLDIFVLANDNDALDGDTLTITGVSAGTIGASIDFSTGTRITYTPNLTSFNVTDTFTYTISDGHGGMATATVTIDILPASLPIARNDNAQTDPALAVAEDSGTTSFNVLQNDFKNESGTFTITAVGATSNGGTATINGNVIDYTPALNHFGTETFTYTISDGVEDNDGVEFSTATVTVTITPVNDAPVAVSDAAITNEDQAITINVRSNDTDVDGDNLTIQSVTQGSNGSVSIVGNQAVYTPALNFFGNDAFSYTITDGQSISTAIVTLTVNSVNDAPTIILQGDRTVNEDSGATTIDEFASNISFGPANESGQVLSIDVSNDNNALFSVQPSINQFSGDLEFTPALHAFGTATVTVTLSDDGGTLNGGADTTIRTFTITVNSVNDAPSFAGVGGNHQTVNEDAGAQTVTGFATNISLGPANESEQTVNFQVSTNNASLFSAGPSISPTGVLTYTPAANAVGTATVTVGLMDNGGILNGGDDFSLAQLFTITVESVNDAPSFNLLGNRTVAEDAGAQTVSGFATNILAGPLNESGQAVNFNVTNDNNALFSSQPTISSTGVLTYTPAADEFGSATVTVTLMDDGGTDRGGVNTSTQQTFTINVTAVNDPPMAVNDSLTAIEADEQSTDQENTTVLDPLANDTDVEGHTLTITSVGLAEPGEPFITDRGATVTISNGGTRIDYLPPVGQFSVTDTFSYTISDGNGGTSTATIIVFIAPASLPRARNDVASVQEDISNNAITVLGNDSKNASGTYTITALGTPSNGGAVSVNPDNTINYTPALHFQGIETFTYTITDNFNDGDGVNFSTATVSVTVTNVNDAPTAVNDTATVVEDSTNNNINVLANDTFLPDPTETLTITAVNFVGATAGGSVTDPGTIDFTGTHLIYTPAESFFGTATYSYTINDGTPNSNATATVTITVNNVNDNPTAVDDMYTEILEDSLLADNLLEVLANDQITPDINETLTITATGTTSRGGTVSIENGTALRYRPAADFFGTETFTYTISDGNNGMAVGNVTVVVDNVNDRPTANDDFFPQILQDSSNNPLDVLDNDTFAPDDMNGNVETLTITGLGPNNDPMIFITDNGSTVEIAPGGKSLIFSPNGVFEGNDTFTYTISDGVLTHTATVTVEVIDFVFGSFSGYVYDDMNTNGSHQTGERAYGGVVVHLTGLTFNNVEVTRSDETDATGKYEFLDVVPGTYKIRIEQPAFTLPGVYDSDLGHAAVVTDSEGTAFEFTFGIRAGTMAMENNFRLSGFDPSQVNSVWDLLASSSGDQAIAIVNTNSDAGEFFTMRGALQTGGSVRVDYLNSTTVRVFVTTSAGVELAPLDIPSVRTTPTGPYFRIMAENAATGMIAIRIIATPAQLGL